MNQYPKDLRDKQQKKFLEKGEEARKEYLFHKKYKVAVKLSALIIFIMFIIRIVIEN
jgi:hypothetical protein